MSTQPAVTGPTPRWGVQTSFYQRHQAGFWVFLLILAVTGLDFLGQQLQMISAVPDAWVLTILLLVPYAVPVIAVIYLLDLYEREPVSILVAALLWGGVVATTLSLYTNSPLAEVVFKLSGSVDFTTEWAPALTAPFVEELFKGLGVVLLIAIARSELDDVLDGFVWGAMVGVGFLLVEDVFYFIGAVAETGTNEALVQMFLIRIVGAGPYSHFLYTGLVGMGLAYAIVRTDRPRGNRLLTGAALIAAGVAAHFLWNAPLFTFLLGDGTSVFGWLAYVTVKGLPMLLGLVLVVRLARQRERRWFAAFAAGFHDDGSITQAELAELGGLRSRRRARTEAGRRLGPRGRQLRGQLQRQQIRLAMTFSRHGSEDHPDVGQLMREIAALRAELAALGAAAPGAVVASTTTVVAVASTATIATDVGALAVGATPAGATPAGATSAGWGEVRVAAPAPPVVAGPPSWVPTHRVPEGGLPAWPAPDPALAPVATLDARLDLAVAERAGDWARVVAVNGWTGWVDARRLVPRG